MFLSTKKTVVKKSQLLPDGREEPVEKDDVEAEETKEVKAPVTKRRVKRAVRQPDGTERVVEEPQSVTPFEVRETKEASKPEVSEKRERGKKMRFVKRKVVETFQRRVAKRVTKKVDGRHEGPTEEEVIRPVEPVSFKIVRRTVKHPDGRVTVTEEPEFELPDDAKPSVEEVKDRRGNVVKIVTTKPVPMITVRKVYRTIIISPDGKEESVQERVEQRQEPGEPGKPGEEEPVEEPRGDDTASTASPYRPSDDEPGSVTVEDGRITRKTVTIRKRIIKRVVVMPDGTRKEVEEEVEEPVEPGREDDQYLIIDRPGEKGSTEYEEPKQPLRSGEQPRREEPAEEIVKPMDIGIDESTPTEPERYEPGEKPREGVVTRRTVTVRKRIIKRVIVLPDGSRKEVEEEVEEPSDEGQYVVIEGGERKAPREPAEPRKEPEEEEVVKPMEVEQVEAAVLPSEPERTTPDEEITTRVDEDGRVTRKVVTVRKRIVKRIIQMPDGTRKEVEEEVPVGQDDKEPSEYVSVTEEGERVAGTSAMFTPADKEVAKREPRHVERVYVTRIMRQRDGSERVVETSESVSPMEALPEDDEPERVEEVKDSRGRVTKKVTTSTVFLSTKKTVVKKSQLLPDGREEPVEKDDVEAEETKEVKAPVTKRRVKRAVRQPDGTERVVEEPQSVTPFEVRETKEASKPEVSEKRERGKKMRFVKRKVVETFQRRVAKRVTKKVDGRHEGPTEEEVIRPVEPVSFKIVRRTVKHPDGRVTVTEEPEFELPDDAKPSVEEVKDRRGNVVKIVTTKPVPMITVRKVYRTIIISPDGKEESVQERVEQRQEPGEPGKPGEEEPVEEPRGDDTASTASPYRPSDDEPGSVTVEDGRITRKTVTIRKRIIKRVVVMPDGTRKEVEEEVEEPVEPGREDDQYLIIDRPGEKGSTEYEEPKQPLRSGEQPRREEPAEEIVKPMDIGIDESTPTEPERYEPGEKPREGVVTRRTVTVRKRIIKRVIVLPDGSRKEVEEEVEEPSDEGQYVVIEGGERKAPREPAEPRKEPEEEEVVKPMEVEQVEAAVLPSEPERTTPDEEITTRVDEDGRVTRKVVTVRKRIVKRIIQMPDGTRKEVEEEVPVGQDDKEPSEYVSVTEEGERVAGTSAMFTPADKEVAKREPRHVERVYVTRIMRQRDGSERVVETSESVSPMEALPEDDEPERVEEVKDSRGRVTKKVTTSTVFLSTKKTVVKKSQLLPDGREEPVEKDDVEAEETKEVKAPVTKRRVKRAVRQPDGTERVVEEPQSVTPFEVRETKEASKPEVSEKRERGKKMRFVKRKVVETFQRRVAKRVTKKVDGRHEGPTEEEVIRPVEPVSFKIVRRTVKHPDGRVTVTEEPEFELPDDAKPSVEEVKDRRGNVVKIVTTKPVPMITVRKVYRTIIISPDGKEESVQERVEQRQEPGEPGKPGEEEPVEEPRGDDTASTASPYRPSDDEPGSVTVEDGRITRKTVTIRKRIIKRVVVMPDGTRKEVEEEVEEPVEPGREDDQYLIIDRPGEKGSTEYEEPKQPLRSGEQPRREEPAEEIVKPMDIGIDESTPTEPERYEPGEKPREGVVTRRTVTVRKRIIKRVIVLPDGSRKEVEEEVEEPSDEGQYVVIEGGERKAPREPAEPRKEPEEEEVVKPMEVEQVEAAVLPSEPERTTPDEEITTRVDEDGRVTRKVVTVRKRIVKRIIQMPDGTRKEVEEEVPVGQDDKEPSEYVSVTEEGERVAGTSAMFTPADKEVAKREPRHVERVYVTRIMRQRDGIERVVETSESVSPMEALPEDDEPERVEEVKDSRGRVTKKVTTSTVFLSTKKTVVKKSQLLPDGREEPVEKDDVEAEETKEVKAPVTKRRVKRAVRQPDGTERVVEEPQSVTPFEVRETKEASKPEVSEKRERGKKMRFVKRKVVETFQRRVAKRVTKKVDGRHEGPTEEEVIRPVEPVSFKIVRRTVKHPDGRVTVTEEPEFELPDDAKPSVEEVKDRRGNVVKIVTTKPVPMITVRKVYRTIIISPDGKEESVQERVEQRQEPGEPGKPGEEEPVEEPRGDDTASTASPYRPSDDEPGSVTVEDGRITRKTVTIRKRIIKRVVVMPDGTRKEVEEEVEEPVEPGREDDQYLIIDRPGEKGSTEYEEPKQPLRSGEQPRREEPAEEIVKPMDIGIDESTPTEPERYEPGEKPREGVVTRRTVTVRKRIIKRVIVLPDGSRKEVEEEVEEPSDEGQYVVIEGGERKAPREPAEPRKEPEEEEVVKPMEVEQVEAAVLPSEPERTTPDEEITTRVDEDGRVTRKVVTVRKRIVKRIIQMPDGTRKEVEEEVPVGQDDKEPSEYVSVTEEGERVAGTSAMFTPADKEVAKREPRHVERVYVTRIMRQRDGSERVVETSESVSPMEALPEDDEPERVEEVKDSRGRVTKKVTTSTVFLSTKKTVVKKSQLLPDGREEPVEKDDVEAEETKEVKAPVTKRRVKRAVRQPDGTERVVEEPQSVTPFEVRETKEASKPEVSEKRERGKKMRFVKRKVVETFQRRVAKRVTKKVDGRHEGPTEEEVIRPVEPVSFKIVRRTVKHPDGRVTVTEEPEFELPDDAKPSVEEVKDRRGNVVKIVTTKPVPMITVRKVYRTIIISPDGKEESVQERVEQRQEPGEPGKPGEEEPVEEPRGDDTASTASPYRPSDDEPGSVTVEDGRITRKTVTIRKRIIKRVVVMPDGTRKEVEEEVEEPVEPGREDDQYLIIDRPGEKGSTEYEEPKQPLRSGEQPRREEPAEEIVKPMDIGIDESTPTEPERYEPGEKPREGVVTRRTVTVRKRIIKRVIVLPDGSRKEVEEEVEEPSDEGQYVVIEGGERKAPREPAEPRKEPEEEEVVKPMEVEQVEAAVLPSEPERTTPDEEITTRVDEDGRVTRKVVTVRKRIVKRIIQMPDGTRKEVEEEVPVGQDDKEPSEYVSVTEEGERVAGTSAMFTPADKEVAKREPRHVERVYVTRIMRQRDGSERVVETSESVSPMEALPEDDEPERVEEVKDSRGRVTKKVTTSTVFLSTKKTVVKKSQLLPDGREEPVEKDDVEAEETKEVKAPVTKRRVKRAVRQPDGTERVVEEPQSVTPFEVRETKEASKPEVSEKRERGKKMRFVKRKVVETFQRRVVKRKATGTDGCEYEPVEENVVVPFEVTVGVVPDGHVGEHDVIEIRDAEGNVVRKVMELRYPVFTTRKVFRTVILSPGGVEESVQERVEDYRKGSSNATVIKVDESNAGSVMSVSQVSPLVDASELESVKPKLVEKVCVTRLLRYDDGTEQIVGKSETLSPLYPDADDERPEFTEDVKDSSGMVSHFVTVTPVYYLYNQETSRISVLRPDGSEDILEENVTKEDKPLEIKAPVIKRINKKMVIDSKGEEMLSDEFEYVEPYEVYDEEEIEKPVVTEEMKNGRKVTIIKRKLKCMIKKKALKRTYTKAGGMAQGPQEEVTIKYVEPKSFTILERRSVDENGQEKIIKEPRYSYPDDAVRTEKLIKDKKGNIINKIVTQPLPAITARKISKVIVLAQDGSEQSVQEKVDESDQMKQLQTFLPVVGETSDSATYLNGSAERSTSSLVLQSSNGSPVEGTFSLKIIDGKRTLKSPEVSDIDGVHIDSVGEVKDQTKNTIKRVLQETAQLTDDRTNRVDNLVAAENIADSSGKGLRQVQRIYQTTFLRQRDGSEVVVQKLEVITPILAPDDDTRMSDAVTLTSDEKQTLVYLKKQAVFESSFTVDNEGEETLQESKQILPEEIEIIEIPVIVKDNKSMEAIAMDSQTVKWLVLKPYSMLVNTEEGNPETSIIHEKGKEMKVIKRRRKERTYDLVSKIIADDGRSVEEEILYPLEPKSCKFIKRTVVTPDGKEVIVEEPEYELDESVDARFEDVSDKHGKIVRKVKKKPFPAITIRKVFETVILSSKGTEIGRASHIENIGKGPQPYSVKVEELSKDAESISEKSVKDLSEEMLESQVLDEPFESLLDTDEKFIIRGGKKFIMLHGGEEKQDATKPFETIYKCPRKVERVFCTVIERAKNGQESILQQSEAIVPINADEDQKERTDDIKDRNGTVVSMVTTTPVSVCQQSTYIKKNTLLPDGKEIPNGKWLVSKDEPKQVAPLRIKKRKPEGKGVTKDFDFYRPFKLREVKMSPQPDITLKKEHGDNVRVFKQRVTETVQSRAVKRVWKTPEGRSQGLEEELVIEPLEVSGYDVVTRKVIGPGGKEIEEIEPEYCLPSDAFTEPIEIKDKKGVVVKRYSKSVLPVVTARKVYRVTILGPKGEEICTNERFVEQDVPKEPELLEVEEILFPAPERKVSETKKGSVSPERKSTSPQTDRKSPISNRKSPVANRKSEREGRRTPSPETKSLASSPKGKVQLQSLKRRSITDRISQADVEEEIIPLAFNQEVESVPGEEIFSGMPIEDLLIGTEPSQQMTVDERNDVARLLFPVDASDDYDVEHSKPKERLTPKRPEKVAKKIPCVSYWQKVEDFKCKQPKTQLVEETIMKCGLKDSQVRSVWEEFVDIKETGQDVDFDSYIVWLSFIESELASEKPLSSRLDILEEQKEYHEVCACFG